MSLTEKAAYLKGLKDGLSLDSEKSEVKLLNAIVDMLQDVAANFTTIEQNAYAIGDELDDINDELDAINEFLDEECDCDDDDDEDEDGEDYDYDDDVFFSVKCPSCDNELTIDESILEQGGIVCPNCGEELEFEIDEECDCGCDHDHDED